MKIFRLLLFPFSILYDAITSIRNILYDRGYQPSVEFEVPVISVGNLAVGGTGKTPMVEYLVRLFYSSFHVVTLSRGYGRRTKGFILANEKDNPSTIGDEPFQIFRKYGDGIRVCVGEERALAISYIMQELPDTQIILMDDAFQHRKVKPSFQVVLTDYNNLFYNDFLLPAGNLRESRVNVKRADAVVVTKCPWDLKADEEIEIEKCIRDYTEKPVFFASIRYGSPIGIKTQYACPQKIVLITAIANSQPLEKYIAGHFELLKHFSFSDHHSFSKRELKGVFEFAAKHNAAILMTEKDASKVDNPEFSDLLKEVSCYYLPIETEFLKNGKDFDEMLLESLKRSTIEN